TGRDTRDLPPRIRASAHREASVCLDGQACCSGIARSRHRAEGRPRMTQTQQYETGPVLDRVLEPFEKWADTGYAEGVVDFLPSLGRSPLLLSPSSLADVFHSSVTGLDPENATEADKEEAARRF